MRKLTLFGAAPAIAAVMNDPAFAHAVGTVGAAESGWSFEPWVALSLGLALFFYAAGVRKMPSSAGRSRVFGSLRVAAFAAGILSLFVALLSPLDGLSAELFSAHMVQHLMLMLIAAPLFVWSRAVLAFIWAAPRPVRKRAGQWWAGGGLGRATGWLIHPVAVWVWFCGIFAFWHLPGPYAHALKSEPVHILEHLSFFLSAYAFWSVVIEPSGRRRLDYGATLLFVATAAILSGLPGALMILAPRPFYAVHAEGVARWGLTLMQDQQLAGLIMWIPGGFFYLATVSVLFVLWLRDAERRADDRLRQAARLAPLAVLMLVVLAGCKDQAAQPARVDFGGDPARGVAQIVQAGCGSCHIIPGITGADGLVGPPLDHIGRRIFIAGLLRNTPDNLMRWLQNPQAIVPGNAMPDMGLDNQQVRDIAAYLYTLQ